MHWDSGGATSRTRKPACRPDGTAASLRSRTTPLRRVEVQEVTGGVVLGVKEACDAWGASEPEAQRRAGMAPYVVEEREGFYRGRELAIPQR
jgi:hypothetical protein